MTEPTAKSPLAYKTISEVAEEIGVPQHVLRFWETRFASLRPLKRGGNRRYYRPEDVALVRQINTLLAGGGAGRPAEVERAEPAAAADAPRVPGMDGLIAIRDRLAAALAAFEAGGIRRAGGQ